MADADGKKMIDMEADVWTAEEAAVYLKVSPELVRVEAKKKRLPGFQVGSLWRFRADAIRSLGYTSDHAALPERNA